jgi:putative ABC transport system permease protein
VHTAVVNELFARHFFPGENPIGRRIEINRWKGQWFGGYQGGTEIVGVVADVRDMSLRRAPRWTVYVPVEAGASSQPRFLFRSTSREVVQRQVGVIFADLHPGAPIPSVESLSHIVATSIAPQRYETTIVMLIAGTALTLTLIGIFSVVAYSVQQRVREIGVRVALGARPASVVGLMICGGMTWVVSGAAVGIVSALALTRFLNPMLFAVTPRDMAVFGATVVILLVCATVACLIPARRALRLDPIAALRAE